MKKSLLNHAISIVISGAVMSGSALSTQAFADGMPVDNENPVSDINSNQSTTETYLLPGMGAGAATGAVVAGPVGLLVGGLIGALVGSNQDVTVENEITDKNLETISTDSAPFTDNTLTEDIELASADDLIAQIHVAQLGDIPPVLDNSVKTRQDNIINILTTDLSLDVYFRTGSTDIETFYPARLAAIAELVKEIQDLELHLDGYSDRRGDSSQNIALAGQRIDNVRQQLVAAGVEDDRIISKAFGEMKMISKPGDLDAYTFDRKVVIRFQKTSPDSIRSMNTALTESERDHSEVSNKDDSVSPVVADATTRF